MNSIELELYLTKSVEGLIANAIQATLSNPRESAFLGSFALRSRRSATKRRKAEERGLHIPPFLIASITDECNLHCTGCYAWETQGCHTPQTEEQLPTSDWHRIFKEADDAGIDFILLAGGEPLMRPDVLEAATDYGMLFPVFTNGTRMDSTYLDYFDHHRNLLPVLSIEGNRTRTDERRGAGVYDEICSVMDGCAKHKLLFGTSITVTRDNISEVTADDFIDQLDNTGCQLVLFIEYVPLDSSTRELALTEAETRYLGKRVDDLRESRSSLLFISFPGDEQASGGCLAAGRGFFHINAYGKAEPCPFSPYSDTDLRTTSLQNALQSPLFTRLRTGACLEGDHVGGCALFEREEEVRRLAGEL